MIDADPIATAVRAVMTTRTTWKGTASDLLSALAEVAGERTVKAKTWPDSPRSLAGRLRRAATFLRKVGIEIGFEREGRGRTRTIYIYDNLKAPTPENAGHATVRIVRNVHLSAKTDSCQRLRDRTSADGRQRYGRWRQRRRPNRPRQPVGD